MKAKMLVVALLAAITLPLMGCDLGSTSSSTATSGQKVVVASKDFTEEIIIGEMYAQLLEQAGIPVERKLNLGSTAIVHPALVKGDVSLYPEYAGTCLETVLKEPISQDANAIYQKVSQEYKSKFQLTLLDAAPMNDTQAIAVTEDAYNNLGIKTMSDFVAKANQVTLISTAEFDAREDGIPGIKKTYGDFNLKGKIDVANAIKYQTVVDGKGNAVIAYSTEGGIAANKLKLLDDDKKLWPPYNIVPVVRDDILAAHPNIKDVLNPLAPKLTTDAITQLNLRVDGPDKAKPADVARDFLKQQGLLK